MGRGAEGNALSNFAFQPEQTAQRRTGNIAQDAGDDDGGGGDGGDTADFFAEGNADGGGDGLGQEGAGDGGIQIENPCHGPDGADAGDGAGQNT